MRRHMVAGGWNPAERGHSTGRPTAPVVARYRCFLPDLAGLAGLRRVGPGTNPSLPSAGHNCLVGKATPDTHIAFSHGAVVVFRS
jgi:hypothetical protein